MKTQKILVFPHRILSYRGKSEVIARGLAHSVRDPPAGTPIQRYSGRDSGRDSSRDPLMQHHTPRVPVGTVADIYVFLEKTMSFFI